MKRRLDQAVRQWLRYEGESRPEQADRALLGVFAHLPLPALPDGFAERVLARAGLAPTPYSPWPVAWAPRAVLSLCLALMTFSILVMPSYLPSLLGIVNPARLTELGVNALVGVLQQLGLGLVVWRVFSSIGAILSSALTSPEFLATLILSVLLSIGAFRMLHDLIFAERSSRYVGSS